MRKLCPQSVTCFKNPFDVADSGDRIAAVQSGAAVLLVVCE